MKITLSKVLSREMSAYGLSVTSLAKKTKIPRTTLHDWLEGRLPSSRNIHHLADLSAFFNLSLNQLLFDKHDLKAEGEVLFTSSFMDNGTQYKIVVEKITKK